MLAIVSSALMSTTPSQRRDLGIVCATVVGVIAIQELKRAYEKGLLDSSLEMCRSLLNRVPAIVARQEAEVQKNYDKFCEEWDGKYAKFGERLLQIPEEGWSEERLRNLISVYAELTNEELVGKHFSGTIYLDALNESGASSSTKVTQSVSEEPLPIAERTKLLPKIFQEAFGLANLWNPLHSEEFTVGPFINYQLVRMVADMFGGKPDEVKGIVTSGGTESLMTAARAYRNWGKRTKDIGPGGAVIVAPDSIHAALLKAGEDYEINIKLARTDAKGNVDLAHMEQLMHENRSNLVAVFASAPSYAVGAVDDIPKISELAGKFGCGMHVDACLGGFIVNNVLESTDYLSMKNVTSLSCDTHKNGLGTKGSSVLLTRPLGAHNLIFDVIYGFPNWECLYATATTAGSQSSIPAFNALLALLCVGKSGFRSIAQQVNGDARDLARQIGEKFSDAIEVIREPQVNVLAIRMKKDAFRKGAIYGLVKIMKERGFTLNALKGQRAHFCVTRRFVSDADAKAHFIAAMESALEEVQRINGTEEKFPGEGALYGTLHEVYNPDLAEQNWGKFLENLLFGPEVAKTVVKKWVEAGL